MHSHTRPLPLSFPTPSPQPLKKPKSAKGELDENDLAFLAKKKAEAAALKEFKEKNAKKK
jgi:sec-independent protein translocase protein TatA